MTDLYRAADRTAGTRARRLLVDEHRVECRGEVSLASVSTASATTATISA